MTEINTSKLALLIDADNTSSKLVGEIISEAGKYGKVTIRRAYGDFSTNHLRNWKDELNKFAIRPMQKFAYTSGKNSTDSAMIIDAMDILHSKVVTGFCIASSDSDYTGLALRIREEGVVVIGVGKASTPEAFQKACEVFVFTENLIGQQVAEEIVVEKKTKRPVRRSPAKEEVAPKAPKLPGLKVIGKPEADGVISKIDKKPIDITILDRAVEMALNDEGLAHLGIVGDKIKIVDPTFDTRTYGFSTLSALFKSMTDRFEVVYKGTSPFIKPKSISI